MSQCTERFCWFALIWGGLVLLSPLAIAEDVLSRDRQGNSSSESTLREPDPAIMAEIRAARGEEVHADDATSLAPNLPFSLDDLLGGNRDKPTVDAVKLIEATANANFLTHELSFQRGSEAFGKLTPPGWLVGNKLRYVGMPAAIAVSGKQVYVIDEITNMLLKLDLQAKTVWPFMDLSIDFPGGVGGVYVTSAGELYLSDRSAGRVVSFSPEGKRQQVFRAPGNLKQPSSVYVNEENGHVMVLDQVFSRILVFNKFAEPIYVLGGRGDTKGHFVDPTSLYVTGRQIYVTDAIGLQAQRLNSFGEAELVFGLDSVFNPSAVARDAYGRVYVSDVSDDFIKIFHNGQLIRKYGGSGVEPGKFREIRAMVIDGDRLYVADGMNRRIQVFKIAPP